MTDDHRDGDEDISRWFYGGSPPEGDAALRTEPIGAGRLNTGSPETRRVALARAPIASTRRFPAWDTVRRSGAARPETTVTQAVVGR